MSNPHSSENFRSDGGERRISRIEIDSNDVLQTNFEIYNSKYNYKLGRNLNPSKSDDLILRNAYTPEQAREIIAILIDEFPKEEPLVTQSALWIRAFSGFHFFYDANHRTGMSTLRGMMELKGIEPFKPFDDFKERTISAVAASKRERKWINRNQMYEKDELYKVWKKYFDDVLGQ